MMITFGCVLIHTVQIPTCMREISRNWNKVRTPAFVRPLIQLVSRILVVERENIADGGHRQRTGRIVSSLDHQAVVPL